MIVVPPDRLEMRGDRAHRDRTTPLATGGTGRDASAVQGLARLARSCWGCSGPGP